MRTVCYHCGNYADGADHPNNLRAELARLQEQVETLTREKERFAELYAREAAAHMAYREASVAEQAKLLALLEGRDNFIVEQGLWPDFVWSLPAALQKEPQPPAQERDDGR